MTASTKPPFPTDTTTLSTLSVCPLTFPQPTARGNDGLRAAYFDFPAMIITNKADHSYQPISAVTVFDCKVDPSCGPYTIPGSLGMGVDAMDRVAWWLLNVAYVNDSAGSDGQPPDIDYEVRAAFGRRAERIAAGTSQFTEYGNNGLFIQVSGVLCTEWEIWARVNPFQLGVAVGTQIQCRFGAVVDRNGGSFLDSTNTGAAAVLRGELGNG